MIEKDLLEILACPETHQPLREADEALVKSINDEIAAGLENVGGKSIDEPIEGGLVREDGAVLYPVRDRIPVLLIDEGIRLEG